MVEKSQAKQEGGTRTTQQADQNKAAAIQRSPAKKGDNMYASNFCNLPLYAHPVQAKLQINTPGDKYEKEADSVANKVVTSPANTSMAGDFISARQQVHTKPLSRHISPLSQPAAEAGSGISQQLNSQVNSSRGKGKNMDEETSSFMSGQFGADFSQVKIHADNESADMNSEVNARAFTVGNDIYFNKGEYDPGTSKGNRLLAHELTHVVQQTTSDLRIQKDDAGDAAAAAATASETKKKTDIITKIKAHGITDVKDGDATFTSGELDLVNRALAGLPPADKVAINGVKIIRVKSLGATTAGMYSNTQGFSGTTITDEQKIEISDLAFGTNTPEESIRLITHEVGHAIAAMPRRVAGTEEAKAGAKFNELIEKSNVAIDEFNTANYDTNAAIDEFNTAVGVFNDAVAAKDKAAIAAAQKEVTAKRTVVNRLQATRTAKETVMNTKKAAKDAQEKVLETKKATAKDKFAKIDDFKTDASSKLTSMEAQFQSATATINSTDTDSAEYRASITATEVAIKKFYDENAKGDVEVSTADAAKSVVESTISDRNKKRDALNKTSPSNAVVGALATLEAAQDNFFKAATIVAFNKTMNLRVRRFYDFVTQKGISSALTKYSAENWPHKPEEFYSEAYSFFVTKPKELEAYSKVLYDWFKAGSYK